MKFRSYLFLALIAACPSASAICIDVSLEQQITKASSVFVATITGASLSPPLEQLQDRQPYTVLYTFKVATRFKGDPSIVTALTTGGYFDDPRDDMFWTLAEQSRYAPGDNILVIADQPGDVPVSSIGCTASRPWTDHAETIVKSILGPAP
jgi:hypothetical protein